MLGIGLSLTRSGALPPLPTPVLDLNYVSTMALSGTETFTRASSAWAFNSAGALTSFATNAPRFDYDKDTLAPKGLLIEEARTNSLRNNSNTGAGVGTLPTNWSVIAAGVLTTNVIAI